ncbi:MAG: CsgG/HfaB family protein [Elusimicrobiota bacterium]
MKKSAIKQLSDWVIKFLLISLLPYHLIICLYAKAKTNLAVDEFTGKNVSTTDASIVADCLRTEIVKTGAYNVVDKTNMSKILAEAKFQQTGCTKIKCAVKIGKILNVQQVIIGSISKLADMYYLSTSLVDVETGKIIKAEQTEVPSIRKLVNAAEELARRYSKLEFKKRTKYLQPISQKKKVEKREKIVWHLLQDANGNMNYAEKQIVLEESFKKNKFILIDYTSKKAMGVSWRQKLEELYNEDSVCGTVLQTNIVFVECQLCADGGLVGNALYQRILGVDCFQRVVVPALIILKPPKDYNLRYDIFRYKVVDKLTGWHLDSLTDIILKCQRQSRTEMDKTRIYAKKPQETKNGIEFQFDETPPGTETVYLAGTFSDWSPTVHKMKKNKNGIWTVTIPLSHGRYQYKFVIDGIYWKEDPNNPDKTDDGYGGYNSVLEIK